MVRLLIVLAVLAVVFVIISLVDCAMQPASRHRGVSKPLWIVIIAVLPVIGGVLWFVIGRGRAAGRTMRAPDDDPEFLRRMAVPSDQDERIRRLEEELAKLDAEDDDPRWGAHGGGRIRPRIDIRLKRRRRGENLERLREGVVFVRRQPGAKVGRLHRSGSAAGEHRVPGPCQTAAEVGRVGVGV